MSRAANDHVRDRPRSCGEISARNSARVLHSECHPTQFGCTDEGVQRYAYDPAKARKLLIEAGFRRASTSTSTPTATAIRLKRSSDFSTGRIRGTLRFLAGPRQCSPPQEAARWQSAATASGGYRRYHGTLSLLHGFSSDDLNRDRKSRSVARGDFGDGPDGAQASNEKVSNCSAERAMSFRSILFHVLRRRQGSGFKSHADDVPRLYEMSWK